MRPTDRLSRFLGTSALAARVYLGYKAITLAEKRLHIRDAAERRSRHHTDSARRLYGLAIRRQGLLIKFGQIIGSRPDLIPDEYIAVLSRLQDQVPPRPFAVIKRRIERQLERPLADVFASFDEKPIAAASLAQVHRATLHDGREVAVKVQYPGIQSIVDNDLRNIRFLMRILARFERNLDFSPLIEEVSHNVPLELDFINEGHNAEMIARNFGQTPASLAAGRAQGWGPEPQKNGSPELKRDVAAPLLPSIPQDEQDETQWTGDGRGWSPAERGNIVVPRIVWEYSTRRVLVMEYLDGIKITDLAGLERAGIDTQAVAQLVIDAYCEQLYLHGMFHADPHPGNLFVQPGPKLIMLDFGLCRQLDDKFRLGYARLVNAMLTWNIPDMVKAFLDLGVKVRNPKDTAVYLELGKGFTEVGQEGRAYADPDLVAEANERMSKAIRANPITDIPREFLLIGRVVGLLSGLGKHLDSRVDMVQTIVPYTKAALEGAK
jgi:predicted unusual protein kinase regulating ubiquinone biosynthesis (AarF/ABC1/UbiB family)